MRPKILLAALFLVLGPAFAATDMAGREVNLPASPKRVVSLLPSITATAFALGRGDRLVGRTSYCVQPAEALSVPVVGDIANPSAESILILQPDLLLASDFGVNQGPLKALEQLGLTVYFLDFKDYESTLESMSRMGQILQAEPEAKAIVDGIREAEAEVRRRSAGLPKPKVMVSIMHGPVWVAGKETFLDLLLEAAGGSNVIQQKKYGAVDTEGILLAAPEVVLVGETESQMKSALEYWNSETLSLLPARKNNRIVPLAQQDTVPGPHMRESFWHVFKALHPDQALP